MPVLAHARTPSVGQYEEIGTVLGAGSKYSVEMKRETSYEKPKCSEYVDLNAT
jgi:hypothetical protein